MRVTESEWTWGPHNFKWERESDLNGEYGPTSFLNGRKRVTEFEWSMGPTSKAIYGSDRFRLKRILFVSLCHLRFKLILTIEWTVHTARKIVILPVSDG